VLFGSKGEKNVCSAETEEAETPEELPPLPPPHPLPTEDSPDEDMVEAFSA